MKNKMRGPSPGSLARVFFGVKGGKKGGFTSDSSNTPLGRRILHIVLVTVLAAANSGDPAQSTSAEGEFGTGLDLAPILSRVTLQSLGSHEIVPSKSSTESGVSWSNRARMTDSRLCSKENCLRLREEMISTDQDSVCDHRH